MNTFNLFSDNGCVSKEALDLYAKQKLSKEEQKKIEQHAKDCELCGEALQGIKFLKGNVTQKTNKLKHRYYSTYKRKNESANQSAIVRLIGPLFLLTGLLVVLWVLNKQNDQFDIKRHYEEKVYDTTVTDSVR